MPPHDAVTLLGTDGAVALALPGFQARPQQLAMAAAVARAIDRREHLMVEAGTGVGKSFAYLVPALLHAIETRKPVVVSTHTKALQAQLHNKDLAFLREALPTKFAHVEVVGRANYLSRRRLKVAGGRASPLLASFGGRAPLDQIADWVASTTDGTRQSLPFTPRGDVWEAVQSDAGNCLGPECPTYQTCFFFKARRQTYQAHLIVVNHALYFSDLALRREGAQLLPDHDVVIFDEAHTLADVASAHLGLRLSSGAIGALIGGLLAVMPTPNAERQALRTVEANDAFFDAVAQHRARLPENGRVRRPTGLPDGLSNELDRLASHLENAAQNLDDPDQRLELQAPAGRLRAQAAGLRTWLSQGIPDAVYWMRDDARPGALGRSAMHLECAPLDVGPVLRTELFERTATCILTSATLSVGNPPEFGFQLGRIGLGPERCRTLALGSPFDYATSVVLHLAANLPDPEPGADTAFGRAVEQAIPHYVEMTGGKALVLFTSLRALKSAARNLQGWFDARGIRLLAQGEGAGTRALLEAFRADVNSVLFGVDSFWQGVDVPGDALSNVIVTKLPFSFFQDPLFEARCESIRASGGSDFREVSLPEAVLKLRQGFGRLIRRQDDQGIVVLLDPRVLRKSYGRTFLASLPDCPTVLDDVGPSGVSARRSFPTPRHAAASGFGR